MNVSANNLSSREIITLAGITQRQLMWWSGQGYLHRVPKPGSGKPLLIDARAAFDVMLLGEMRRRGLPISSATRLLRLLSHQLGEGDGWKRESHWALLIGGVSVRYFSTPEAVVRCAAGNKAVQLIDIAEQWRRLEAYLRTRK